MATHVPVSKPVPVGAGSQGGRSGRKRERLLTVYYTHLGNGNFPKHIHNAILHSVIKLVILGLFPAISADGAFFL